MFFANKHKYKNFFGGKPDDITVVVAQVLNESNYENESSSTLSNSLCAGAASNEIFNSTVDTMEDENLSTGSDGSY